MILARENNIDIIDRGSFVGYLTKQYENSICISGTHGKTTTTSMVSLCFLEASLNPTIQVGAILKQINGNYHIGDKKYFILEACEYKNNFLKFFPKSEIILNIDNDHLDFFGNFENIKKSFKQYASLVPQDGFLITNADDKSCLELKHYCNGNFITYGIENKNANYVATNITFDDNGFPEFDVIKNNEFFEHFNLSVSGMHNILNALASISLCDCYNIKKSFIKSALKKFTGAHRRLEYLGKFNEANLYDDYGHHPTEIKATSNAILSKKYSESWVVFQAHTYSRTKTHLEDFAKSLLNFDHIIITDIYAAREINTFNVTPNDLVEKILELKNTDVIYIKTFNEITKYLKANVKKGDIVLTLGAGDIEKVGPMLLK